MKVNIGPALLPPKHAWVWRRWQDPQDAASIKVQSWQNVWIISHTHKNKAPSADRWCWSIRGGINQTPTPQTACVSVWKPALWGHDGTSACLRTVRVKRGLRTRSHSGARRCVFVRIARWDVAGASLRCGKGGPVWMGCVWMPVCARFKDEPTRWHPIKCRSIPPLEPS